VTHLPVIANVGIGVGIAIVGAYLPWGLAFVAHLATAGGVTARERIGVLENTVASLVDIERQKVRRTGGRDELGLLLSEVLDAAEDFQLFHDDADHPDTQEAVRKAMIPLVEKCKDTVKTVLGPAELALLESSIQSKSSKVTHPYVDEMSPDAVAWRDLCVCASWLEQRIKKMAKEGTS